LFPPISFTPPNGVIDTKLECWGPLQVISL
jgi:hypothetical protein